MAGGIKLRQKIDNISLAEEHKREEDIILQNRPIIFPQMLFSPLEAAGVREFSL
jgi:hypothetical protein